MMSRSPSWKGLVRSGRSLIVIDWTANREIHDVVGNIRSKYGLEKPES